MEKKFELTDETFSFVKTYHRIRALRDFGDVKKGDLGGFVEREGNLSHAGNAWISGNAKVRDNACVLDDAIVSGSALICDEALISGDAQVHGTVIISNNATICNNAKIYGNARVCGKAVVDENAEVYDNALIEGRALVKTSQVCGCSYVAGTAVITDGGKVSQNQHVCSGVVKTDLSKDLAASIRLQCNLPVINNKVVAYKLVRPDFTSFYDTNFKYEVGKIIEAESYDLTLQSCAAGLHFSNLNYWESAIRGDFICLEAEIDLDDVITVQEGKIRCKRAKILRAFHF
jgi:carbonic anhydrase/acetyltransferase-like protein (isoleucine patch superfamily)